MRDSLQSYIRLIPCVNDRKDFDESQIALMIVIDTMDVELLNIMDDRRKKVLKRKRNDR